MVQYNAATPGNGTVDTIPSGAAQLAS
jgi:hypothetical protein